MVALVRTPHLSLMDGRVCLVVGATRQLKLTGERWWRNREIEFWGKSRAKEPESTKKKCFLGNELRRRKWDARARAPRLRSLLFERFLFVEHRGSRVSWRCSQLQTATTTTTTWTARTKEAAQIDNRVSTLKMWRNHVAIRLLRPKLFRRPSCRAVLLPTQPAGLLDGICFSFCVARKHDNCPSMSNMISCCSFAPFFCPSLSTTHQMCLWCQVVVSP